LEEQVQELQDRKDALLAEKEIIQKDIAQLEALMEEHTQKNQK